MIHLWRNVSKRSSLCEDFTIYTLSHASLYKTGKQRTTPLIWVERFWGQYQYIDPTLIRSVGHVLWHANTTQPDTFGAAALHWLSLEAMTLKVTTLLLLAALTTIFNPKPSFCGDLWPLHLSRNTAVIIQLCWNLWSLWDLTAALWLWWRSDISLKSWKKWRLVQLLRKSTHLNFGYICWWRLWIFIGALGQNQMEMSTKPGELTRELFCMWGSWALRDRKWVDVRGKTGNQVGEGKREQCQN